MWSLTTCFRLYSVLVVMMLWSTPSVTTFLTVIGMCMPKMNLIPLVTLFIILHHWTKFGWMSQNEGTAGFSFVAKRRSQKRGSGRIRAPTSPPEPPHDDDDQHIPPLSIVSDSDDDDSDNDESNTDSIAPSHQEGEVSDPGDSFDPGGNVGVDEQEHVSPRYPWQNRKKKQSLAIDFDNKRHNVFACSKSQDMPVRAYK